MGVYAGPDLKEDGLVLALDAASPKNYNLTAVEVLVVAGGGGGGAGTAGGGGGGGLIYNSNFSVTPGSALTVTVGAGGTGKVYAVSNSAGDNGGNSVFGSLTAIGGGGGGNRDTNEVGKNGGSGGGGGGAEGGVNGAGTGTSGQGFAGGVGRGGGGGSAGGGGGGAGGVGQASPSSGLGGNGGPGLGFDISGTFTYYGGGGGGGSHSGRSSGGIGGGGAGSENGPTYNAVAGTTNTGGGGGGGGGAGGGQYGGNGGSGIVIVRYLGPQRAVGGTVTSSGGYTIHTFTTTGSTTFTPLVATNNSAILGLTDLSERNNFATSVNGPTYSSANGGSLVFDGTDDYILVSSNASIPYTSSARTVSIWFYTNTTTWTDDANNLFFYGTSSTRSAFGIDMAPYPNMQFYAWSDDLTFATTYSQVGWKNICITYNGSTTVLIYENGVFTRTKTLGGTLNTSTSDVYIGAINPSVIAGGYYDGRIATTQIYNRALSAAEIQQNYNATKTRYIRVGDGSSASNPAPSASYLVSLGITTNGFYYINLPTVGSTLVYCILDPAVDGGGWMVLWGAAQGATNYTYSFSASRDDTSNSPINGFYSLSYAKRSAINSICTQNKTLVYAGSNSNWLRFDGYIWNSNSHTSGDFRFEFNSSLVTSNGTVDSSVEVGLTNYNVPAGGDFGIAINTDGLDHHSGNYYNLNGGCVNMYLYQYASGYKVNTGLSGWYNSTAGCTSDNENDLPLLVAMK